jgi:hypothetical protein
MDGFLYVGRLQRLAFTALLTSGFLGAIATGALSAITCKPILSIKYVREMRRQMPQIQPWAWRATIMADTRYCATASGEFEIDFIRIKEYAPDIQFTEKYRWAPGQFDVTVELTMDEAIHKHRIGFIAPCVCRDIPFK